MCSQIDAEPGPPLNANTSSAVMARIVNAHVRVMTYAISSPLRRRCQKADARPEVRALMFVVEDAAINLGLLNLGDCFDFFGDNWLWQLSV